MFTLYNITIYTLKKFMINCKTTPFPLIQLNGHYCWKIYEIWVLYHSWFNSFNQLVFCHFIYSIFIFSSSLFLSLSLSLLIWRTNDSHVCLVCFVNLQYSIFQYLQNKRNGASIFFSLFSSILLSSPWFSSFFLFLSPSLSILIEFHRKKEWGEVLLLFTSFPSFFLPSSFQRKTFFFCQPYSLS